MYLVMLLLYLDFLFLLFYKKFAHKMANEILRAPQSQIVLGFYSRNQKCDTINSN